MQSRNKGGVNLIKTLKPISQYIKDLSFENYAAQKNQFQSKKLDLNIDLNIKKKVLKKDLIEVTLIIFLEAKETEEKKFVIELSYASTFFLNPALNTVDEKKFAFINCPHVMFPFVREIIYNISRDSGFLPINLEYIDFLTHFNLKEKN